jgi:hypothetical protein
MASLKQEGSHVYLIRAIETVTRASVFHARWALLAIWAAGSLTACAPLPTEADSERLDTGTGTTLTLMPRPVELIVTQPKATKTDPFAYLAPFETNRMGSHDMYLWVSAPQVAAPLGVPKVFCGNDLIPLEVAQPDLKAMGLSSPPYAMPAPWRAQWYFKLSGEVLDCLTGASRLKLTTQAADGEAEDYAAEAAALAGLKDFAARVRT